jgi:hypothetical protein
VGNNRALLLVLVLLLAVVVEACNLEGKKLVVELCILALLAEACNSFEQQEQQQRQQGKIQLEELDGERQEQMTERM